MGLTWMNGRFVAEGEVMVPFLTAGLHYGIDVFEGIRCYDTAEGTAVFRLRDHVQRLTASAPMLGWRELPFDEAALTTAIHETMLANHLRACYSRRAGLRIDEARFARDRLYDADEVFLTGTAAEVVGVRDVDFRPVGSGFVGPVTRALQQAFHQTVRGEHRRSAEWLEPVRGAYQAEQQPT